MAELEFEDAVDWEAQRIKLKEKEMDEEIRIFKNGLKKRDEKMDQLRRVGLDKEANLKLFEKVKRWEEKDRMENTRKREVREELEEENILERTTRLRVRNE